MNFKPILDKEFYHDGRGPELQSTVWDSRGVTLAGFEYFNPGDKYDEKDLKHIRLEGLQVYSMAPEEVHGKILSTTGSKAAIHEIENSEWLESFLPTHLSKCRHYQIVFYDEIYDVICEKIIVGQGKLISTKI